MVEKYYPKIQELYGLYEKQGFIAYTHGGKFHADDMLSAALLDVAFRLIDSTAWKNIRIARFTDKYLNDNNLNDSNALIFDIGRGRFDHHQEDCPVRYEDKPKTKYASLGRLWNYIGEEVCLMYGAENEEAAKYAAKYLDETFIQNMDKTDNFGPKEFPNTLAYYVNATYNEAIALASTFDGVDVTTFVNEAFNRLCRGEDFIKFDTLITHAVECGNNQLKVNELANSTTENYIVLDDYIPAMNFTNTHIQYVIYKSNRDEGCWTINSVNNTKYPIPVMDIIKDQYKNCKFVHQQEFTAVFTDKESAIEAVKFIIDIKYHYLAYKDAMNETKSIYDGDIVDPYIPVSIKELQIAYDHLATFENNKANVVSADFFNSLLDEFRSLKNNKRTNRVCYWFICELFIKHGVIDYYQKLCEEGFIKPYVSSTALKEVNEENLKFHIAANLLVFKDDFDVVKRIVTCDPKTLYIVHKK